MQALLVKSVMKKSLFFNQLLKTISTYFSIKPVKIFSLSFPIPSSLSFSHHLLLVTPSRLSSTFATTRTLTLFVTKVSPLQLFPSNSIFLFLITLSNKLRMGLLPYLSPLVPYTICRWYINHVMM